MFHKKIISLFLLLAAAGSLANCGSSQSKKSESSTLTSNGSSNQNNDESSPDTNQDIGGIVNLPPVVLEATFASINTGILQRKCTGCHSGSMPSGDRSFENHEQVINLVDLQNPGAGILLQRVSATDNSIMPPVPFLPLSTTEIEVIQEWVELGAPNN